MAATRVPKDRVNFGPDVLFHLEKRAFEGGLKPDSARNWKP